MTVRIDRKLNLVVPLYSADGKTVIAHVHSVPLAEEVVDKYFLVLGQTYNAVMSSGLGVGSGPGHSMRMLKLIATRAGEWESRKGTKGDEDLTGVKDGLVGEIRRCTNVLAPMNGKWASVPLAQAEARGYLDPEDRGEVENAIVFFMCVCATLPRVQRKDLMDLVCALWSAQTSPLTPMEFASSLPMSKGTDSSGETAKPVSVPVTKDAPNTISDQPALAVAGPKPPSVVY